MKLPINEELKRGIERATRDLGQPASLSQRLVAWLNEMSERELTKQDQSRHLSIVRSAVGGLGGEEQDEN